MDRESKSLVVFILPTKKDIARESKILVDLKLHQKHISRANRLLLDFNLHPKNIDEESKIFLDFELFPIDSNSAMGAYRGNFSSLSTDNESHGWGFRYFNWGTCQR